MFDGIAQKYDLLNAITSLGLDKYWRKKAVAALALERGETLLDLAAGTLDVSIAAQRRFPEIQIIAADPSKEMLKSGRQKIPHNAPIAIIKTTGESLPIADSSIHGAIIAFGIRNFSDRTTALDKLAAALVPGGRLVILELSIPNKGLFAPLARFYVQQIIPRIGAMISSGAEYAYLPRSMKKFPSPPLFAVELKAAGFHLIRINSFMSGACHLFISEKK